MRLQPKRAGAPHWIDIGFLPPRGRRSEDLAVMAAAQQHGKLVADLAAQCAELRETKMVGI